MGTVGIPKKEAVGWLWWLIYINLATREVEVRRIQVRDQPGEKVRPHLKKQGRCSGRP
jgi:hypothetical protein